MVAVGNMDFTVGAKAGLSSDHQSGNPRGVGLKCQGEQVVHEPEVIAQVDWRGIRLRHVGPDRVIGALGLLDAPFDVAYRRQVLIQLTAVRGAERAFEAVSVRNHPIEDALLVPSIVHPRSRIVIFGPKQPLKYRARVYFRRTRRSRRAPRYRIAVHTAVADVAESDHAAVFARQLQRGQAGRMADVLSRHLIHGNPDLDIGAARFFLHGLQSDRMPQRASGRRRHPGLQIPNAAACR